MCFDYFVKTGANILHDNRTWSLVLVVVGNAGCSVELGVDAMSAVGAYHGEVVSVGVFRDDVAHVTVSLARFACLNGLVKAFICRSHELQTCFIHVSNQERLIQISVHPVVVNSDVYVDNVSILATGSKQGAKPSV